MKLMNLLTLEISITDQCNMRCTYCFERDYGYEKRMTVREAEKIADRIVEITKEEQFKNLYDGLNITFWGGEPTVNRKVLEYFYYRLKKEIDVIEFFIYTNGIALLDYIDIIKNNDVKFQISYDGMPVHDRERKTVKGQSTSEHLLHVFKVLAEERIGFGLKSTLIARNFKFLVDIYNDFRDLNEKIFKPNNMFMTYAPTIDYHSSLRDEDFLIFKQQLHEIAKLEIQALRRGENFTCEWFTSSAGGTCAAGESMFAITKDGTLYNCHGAIYENETSLKEGDFFSNDFLDLIECRKKNSIYEVPEKCKTCASTICQQCNVVLFSKSKKSSYIERWNDIEAHGLPLCRYYDEITKYKTVIANVINPSASVSI